MYGIATSATLACSFYSFSGQFRFGHSDSITNDIIDQLPRRRRRSRSKCLKRQFLQNPLLPLQQLPHRYHLSPYRRELCQISQWPLMQQRHILGPGTHSPPAGYLNRYLLSTNLLNIGWFLFIEDKAVIEIQKNCTANMLY
jgi:hypothetical protein